jgi:hypothetical protein
MRRILIGLLTIGVAAMAIWAPREEPVTADTLLPARPPAVSFRAGRVVAAPPFVEGWELQYPETPPAVQALTLQIGAVDGPSAPGLLTAGVGAPATLLARIGEVLGDPAAPGADVPPVDALDLRLELLGEGLSIDEGDPGGTVIAGAFVAGHAGPWRAYRLSFGEGGPGCFFGVSEAGSSAVFLLRAIEDGPAIQARFRALLLRPVPRTN